MSLSTLALGLVLTALPLGSNSPAAEQAALSLGETSLLNSEASGWIADSTDHICGLSSLRVLSFPAKVTYSDLWDATPEIKEMTADGIAPDSARGIQLQKLATDRILKACKEVMKDKSHCSVWKKIKHEDERDIFMSMLSDAVYDVFNRFLKYTKGVDGAILYDEPYTPIDPAVELPNVVAVKIVDHEAYNTNYLRPVDKVLEKAIRFYILKEWFSMKDMDSVAVKAEGSYVRNMNDLLKHSMQLKKVTINA